MTRTAPASTEHLHSMTDNKSMLWGFGLGLFLALVIIFSQRTISNQESLSETGAGVSAPAPEK